MKNTVTGAEQRTWIAPFLFDHAFRSNRCALRSIATSVFMINIVIAGIYMMTLITQMLLMQVFVSGSNLQLNEKYGLQGLGGSIK
jgi:hypothetical protein